MSLSSSLRAYKDLPQPGALPPPHKLCLYQNHLTIPKKRHLLPPHLQGNNSTGYSGRKLGQVKSHPLTPHPLVIARDGGGVPITDTLHPLALQIQGPLGQPAATLAEIYANQRGVEAMEAYPTMFDLLKDEGKPSTAERMATITSLLLQEWPALLIIVDGPPLRQQFLWGIDNPPLLLRQEYGFGWTDHLILTQCCGRATPTTVTINPDWWDLKDYPVVLPSTASTKATIFYQQTEASTMQQQCPSRLAYC